MAHAVSERLGTGITGLDEILHGGLLPQRTYLVGSGPGTGKTTLGAHFRLQCEHAGQSLFVTLGESQQPIRRDAARAGLDPAKGPGCSSARPRGATAAVTVRPAACSRAATWTGRRSTIASSSMPASTDHAGYSSTR